MRDGEQDWLLLSEQDGVVGDGDESSVSHTSWPSETQSHWVDNVFKKCMTQHRPNEISGRDTSVTAWKKKAFKTKTRGFFRPGRIMLAAPVVGMMMSVCESMWVCSHV